MPVGQGYHAMTHAQLDRYVDVLREELLGVERQMAALRSGPEGDGAERAESQDTYLRLDIKRSAVLERYRAALEAEEQARLDALADRVREADGD